jgi:hypothetical protein
MWTEVVFEGATASRGLELAARLRLAGLVLNQDFTWAYIPKAPEEPAPPELFEKNVSLVIIGFQDPAMATFYSLKWQR